jgi:hypothetical protein
MNVLDIVTELNREFRRYPAFLALLRDCDEDTRQRVISSYAAWLFKMLDAWQYKNNDETTRRITQSYIEWLYQMLDVDKQEKVIAHVMRRAAVYEIPPQETDA